MYFFTAIKCSRYSLWNGESLNSDAIQKCILIAGEPFASFFDEIMLSEGWKEKGVVLLLIPLQVQP